MIMNRACKEIFGPIRAEEPLKARTRAFLAEKTRGYARAGAENARRRVRAAACACVLLLLLGGRWLYFTPTAEISIDINPSIELSVNRFDRVLFVNGLNEDGQELSSRLDVKFKPYAEAVEQILNDDGVAALLSGDEIMTITVVGSSGRQSASILSGVETCAAGRRNVDCYAALPEEAAAAHETGLSCGKYRAFLELRLLDPAITPEAVQNMTMREIRERIDRLSAGAGNDIPPYGGQGAGHFGHGGHGNGWRSAGAEQRNAGE